MLKHWILWAVMILCLSFAPPLAASPPAASEWQGFTRRYLAPEGRVGGPLGPPLGVADAPDYFGASLVLQARIAPHMPVEPPALVPEAVAAPASRMDRMMEAAQSVWSRFSPSAPEAPSPAGPAAWTRQDAVEPSQVRGVQGGLRGLVPPR